MANKLYVGNLPYSATEGDLRSLFEEHGPVESVRLITDRDTGRSKGFAFVEMGNQDDAGSAISGLNETDFQGRTIRVSEARPKGPREGGGGGGGGGYRGGGGRSGNY